MRRGTIKGAFTWTDNAHGKDVILEYATYRAMMDRLEAQNKAFHLIYLILEKPTNDIEIDEARMIADMNGGWYE